MRLVLIEYEYDGSYKKEIINLEQLGFYKTESVWETFKNNVLPTKISRINKAKS